MTDKRESVRSGPELDDHVLPQGDAVADLNIVREDAGLN